MKCHTLLMHSPVSAARNNLSNEEEAMKSGKGSRRGPTRRSNRRESSALVNAAGTRYKADKNGCKHGDPEWWQFVSNKVYWQDNYQQALAENERLSKKCVECDHPII